MQYQTLIILAMLDAIALPIRIDGNTKILLQIRDGGGQTVAVSSAGLHSGLWPPDIKMQFCPPMRLPRQKMQRLPRSYEVAN